MYQEPAQKLRTFDEYLQLKVGVGSSQYWGTLGVSMICLADGAEIFVMGFLMPVLKKDWGLSDSELSSLAFCIFLGQLIGNLLGGVLADRVGRKTPLLLGSVGICVSAILSAFSKSLLNLQFLRFLFGFSMGIVVPVIACYITEIYPQNVRGKFYLYMGQAFPVGEVITILLAWFYLDTLEQGDWRKLLLMASVPSLICLILVSWKVKPSARFEFLVKKNYSKAFEVLDAMGKENSAEYENISEDQKNYLIINKTELDTTANFFQNYSQLFSPKLIKITFLQSLKWFSLSFIFYGVGFMLPTILIKMRQNQENQNFENFENNENLENNENHHSDMAGILLAVLVEFPSNQLAAFLIEKKEFGRKKLLLYSYLVCAASCIFASLCSSPNFVFFTFIVIVKFTINICFVVVYPFASEIYPTQLRATALGYLNAVCRIGGMIMPFVSYYFFLFGNTGPLLASSAFAALSAAAAFFIPRDTTDIELDTYTNELELQENQY